MGVSFLAEWELDPLWRTEVYLAVFQVFITGRGRIFSKEDVGKVANASGICGFQFAKGKNLSLSWCNRKDSGNILDYKV